ncbi:MAG: NAD/NADP octopine/nopaline dehydrogenase family protein [Candidatus Cloacimonetes bacterium]|nr:NAD/NADP octopine/nopaline dehydrogenase family protein [Candidatus Cloacimonadota bacterium]
MKYKITVVGTGNGGHAIAGHFAMLGHQVSLFGRNASVMKEISANGGIELLEAIEGFGQLHSISDNYEEALRDSEIIMVATTANAHGEIAKNLAPYLKEGQIIVLNPGRTGGAIEFRHELKKQQVSQRVYVAEAQSLIYACRIVEPGRVRIIGVKSKVLLSALPHTDTPHVIDRLNEIYPCFIPVENVLDTSFENIGAIFHPSIVLFNAATIERGQGFYFYNDMTKRISEFLEKLDAERMNLGTAYGIDLITASDWISYAYPNIPGDDFCERMRNNPAYYMIPAPKTLDSRLLFEDIPTGILPMIEFSELAGVKTPLMNAVYTIGESLLGMNFRQTGRTLKNLGLDHLSIDQIKDTL